MTTSPRTEAVSEAASALAIEMMGATRIAVYLTHLEHAESDACSAGQLAGVRRQVTVLRDALDAFLSATKPPRPYLAPVPTGSGSFIRMDRPGERAGVNDGGA